jgi:hypothetical protein
MVPSVTRIGELEETLITREGFVQEIKMSFDVTLRFVQNFGGHILPFHSRKLSKY